MSWGRYWHFPALGKRKQGKMPIRARKDSAGHASRIAAQEAEALDKWKNWKRGSASMSTVDPTTPQHKPTPTSPAGAGQSNPEAEPRHSASGVAPETWLPAAYDVNTLTAARSLGILPCQVTAEQRRFARDIINFGSRYGQ